MSREFVVKTIDDSIFSELVERHFFERGDHSAVLSRVKAEMIMGEFAAKVVREGLTADLLREKMENNYNKEMVDLLRFGFRTVEFGIRDSIGDLYLEMLNSKITSMPLGRSIISSEFESKIFEGKHVEAMKNSIISDESFVGDYSYIGYNCLISNATVGRYCSIANNVSIGPGEHALGAVSTNSIFMNDVYRELTAAPCTVGHDVWIGANSVIRRGVKIGNGAVVGANSFVNADVPDFAIVVGAPARLIKFRFDDETQDIIRRSKWWEQDFDQAKEVIAEIGKSIRMSSEVPLEVAPGISEAGR
jgi:acetyltransferase-like isoleucine patch superfamily enzyme